MRRTGLPIIGDVPWGTHFCQFYQEKQDLIDILVPYFKAGLASNEFCVWVTSEPLRAEEAKAVLAAEVDDLESYIGKAQLEILDYTESYTAGGKFESDRVLQGLVDRLKAGLARGFDGLRLTGNMFWLERADWQDFMAYEAAVDAAIGQCRMLAICTYSLAKCVPIEIIDVVSNHGFALIKRAGEWQIIESAGWKKAEATLRESEERHRTILQTAMDGFVILDLEGRLLEVNEAYCRMAGYSAEELLAMRIPDLEAGEKATETAAHIRRIMAQGEDRFESRHRRKDGSMIDVEVSVQYRAANGGQFVAFLRDITERKRHEEEEERLLLQLAQAQKMESIGRLAGGVAHDFNNLLTVINGYAGFLSKELAVRDPLRAYALEIGQAGAHAASLTSQLLAFSRKQAIQPRAVDLNAVIADAKHMLQRLIAEDIELVTRPAPRLGLVMADPDQIHQVIMNLVANARDAMPKGGKIEIATAEVNLDEAAAAAHTDAAPGRYIQLSVSDTGTGMTEEVRRNIFEPFFTTKPKGKGTGLGLATVYGIVRQNDGWIEVKSEVGRGSVFRVHLSRIDPAPLVDEAKVAAVDASHGVETVLVVEDQEAVRRLAKLVLEARGYRVLEAANGTEAQAIARLRTCEIDLLLTDVVMPGMDGHTLAKQLGDLCPNLRVILMSGFAEDVIIPGDALAGCHAYIQKPFTAEELAARVRGILDAPV